MGFQNYRTEGVKGARKSIKGIFFLTLLHGFSRTIALMGLRGPGDAFSHLVAWAGQDSAPTRGELQRRKKYIEKIYILNPEI